MTNFPDKCRRYYRAYAVVIENMSYVTAFQIFTLLVPLVTYPYLIRVLGAELYGWVITSQVLVSYFSLFIDYGFRKVTTRHISVNRSDLQKLSEIVSSVIVVKFILWVISLMIYLIIIFCIQPYREHILLFLFSYGITFNDLLFPQFYFQGIEKMKYVTMLNIVIKSIFLVLTFLFISSQADYFLVPVFLSIGSLLGGIIAFYIMFYRHGLSFSFPSIGTLRYYTKDATPVFCTDMICTIKDKLNYFLIGGTLNMSDVAIYDLGSKLMNVVARLVSVIGVALFPRMARERNILLFKKSGGLIVLVTLAFILVLELLLPIIVPFLYAEKIDLLPIRLYLLAPLFLELSSFISSNLFIALGYNKFVLYSIVFTTIIYVTILSLMWIFGYLSTVTAFVVLALISYVAELLYRIYLAKKVMIHQQDTRI